jgi:hypothetical protein
MITQIIRIWMGQNAPMASGTASARRGGKFWTRERFRSWECEASSHRFSINGLLPQKATREHPRTAGRQCALEKSRRLRDET